MKEGNIVIIPTMQSGTVQWVAGDTASVLLRNGEIWVGLAKHLREPQEGELEIAPIHVERKEPSAKKRRS